MAITLNIEGIATSSFANDSGVLCTLYTIDESGEVLSLISNERSSVVMDAVRSDDIKNAVNTMIQKVNEHEAVYKGPEKAYYFARDGEVQTVTRRSMKGREVVSCIAPLIAKDGTCCTALEVSCHVESFLSTMMDGIAGTLLLFLMTVVSIVIISDEVIRLGTVYLRYRRMREEGVEWAEILMGRPLSFTINLAFSMDAAFAVVVAKDMLASSGMESTPILLGIPTFAITMGAAIGTLVLVWRSFRFSCLRFPRAASFPSMAKGRICTAPLSS